MLKSLLWTEEETRAVAPDLSILSAKESSPMRDLVRQQLRPTGAYQAYAESAMRTCLPQHGRSAQVV